jgi:hypothetical protein
MHQESVNNNTSRLVILPSAGEDVFGPPLNWVLKGSARGVPLTGKMHGTIQVGGTT